MKTKQTTEVLHETHQTIQGDEPFLGYNIPYMIINLSGGWAGSHNFFEGRVFAFEKLKPGDVLGFQVVRVSQIEITWRERLADWVRGVLCGPDSKT